MDTAGVLRVTATVAVIGFGGAIVTESIWKASPWANSLRHLLDALIYGLLTGATFTWLWPS